MVDGRLHLYDLSQNGVGSLQPVASFEVPAELGALDGYAAHPMLDGLVYATATQAVRVGADGRVRWRIDLGMPTDPKSVCDVGCGFSIDGEFVWLYVPDALLDRGPDRLLVLDASGTTVAQTRLDTVGHGAGLQAHPDGHMIVDVGEGQEGIHILRCRTEAGVVLVEEYPWIDRVLIGFSPDGSRFMTRRPRVSGGRRVPRLSQREVVAAVTKTDLGDYDDEASIEWTGGYLDPTTAMMAVVGYDEDTDEDWHRCHLVDADSGRVRGVWHVDAEDAPNIKPLGDGTWLHLRHNQLPQRHAFRVDVDR